MTQPVSYDAPFAAAFAILGHLSLRVGDVFTAVICWIFAMVFVALYILDRRSSVAADKEGKTES